MSTAFHQETNGQVERIGKDIMQTLQIYTNNKGSDWADNLWPAKRMHNTMKSSWHYLTSYEMVYRHLAHKIPTELPQTKIPTVEGYLDDLICWIQEASDALILVRARTADTVSKWHNPNAIPCVGDYVVYRRRTFNGKSKKLHTVWDELHKVIGYNEDTGNCHLKLPASKKVHP